jgi:hypothetical protein
LQPSGAAAQTASIDELGRAAEPLRVSQQYSHSQRILLELILVCNNQRASLQWQQAAVAAESVHKCSAET